MCGINGILLRRNVNLKDKLRRMNDTIIHRGPDDDGEFYFSNETISLAMGMRRLSIIDLQHGKQPMHSEDGQITIVFNGEIYNFLSLKKKLEKKNCAFATKSDTEVILKGYEKEGTNFFSQLDGMFAFSIFDRRIGKLFVARDFFGEKPLYYFHDSSEFIWASELKSILGVLEKVPTLDKSSLNLFFQLSYIPSPHSIFACIKKLPPYHYLEIDINSGNFLIKEIPHTPVHFEVPDKSSAIQLTEELVRESVISRSIADVPLGTFLSGGVDSSIVALCLSQHLSEPIETFSICFEKKSFDEREKSRLVSKIIGSKHHEFILSEKHLSDKLCEIFKNFDEPFADSSALPTFWVAKMAREHITVALTGDGGDEVFGGYNKYYVGKLNSIYTKRVPKFLHQSFRSLINSIFLIKDDSRGWRFKLHRLLSSIDYDDHFYFNIISLAFQKNELNELFQPDYTNTLYINDFEKMLGYAPKTLNDFRTIDRWISLEGDMLVKVDRTSMLNSLECRAPFLNKKLWDFSHQVPEHFLLHRWDKKHLLKEAFKKYFPKGFLDKSKKGFGVPVGDWLRGYLKQELQRLAEPQKLQKQGIFQPEYIQRLIHRHLEGKRDNTFRVWAFYCFQKWYYEVYGKS